MPMKQFKAYTPGRRFMSIQDNSDLSKVAPERSLLVALKNSGGRNNTGRITMRHIGGGGRRLYRVIDFKRDKDNIPARVATIEYDPNRSANIALLNYADGEKRYILAPKDLKVGMSVVSGETTDIKIGNCLQLKNIPDGTFVHNVEMKPGKGGQIARSAGTYVQLVGRDGGKVIVRLNSGEQRYIHAACMATVGQVGNADWSSIKLGKAGRKRLMGIRPTVRGVAMNPVDHPMGGGEGRTSGGSHPRSPWCKLSKGGKTRNRRKTSSRFIVKRRK